MRLTLTAQGITPDTESVRMYQAQKFGCVGGGTVIAEMMPLPSRNLSQWIYSSLTGILGLETREQYVQQYRPRRVALLREAIQAAAPRAVVFLGTSERETWAQIAGTHFIDGPAGAAWAQMGATRLVMLTHPTAYGAKNAYFESVGRELSGKP